MSVVPLSVSVLLPTFVRTKAGRLLTLPLSVISPLPPTVNARAGADGPGQAGGAALEFTSAPLPPTPVPEMLKPSLPTACPPKSRVAPLVIVVPAAVLPKALTLPSTSVPTLIAVVPE